MFGYGINPVPVQYWQNHSSPNITEVTEDRRFGGNESLDNASWNRNYNSCMYHEDGEMAADAQVEPTSLEPIQSPIRVSPQTSLSYMNTVTEMAASRSSRYCIDSLPEVAFQPEDSGRRRPELSSYTVHHRVQYRDEENLDQHQNRLIQPGKLIFYCSDLLSVFALASWNAKAINLSSRL